MSTKLPIIEQIRRKALPNPYEIKESDIGRLLTLQSGDFGAVIPADVGKRVYLRDSILQMENTEQMNKRKGKGWHEMPDHTGKAPVHKKVAERAQAKHARNTPMKKKESNGKKTPSYKPPYRVDVWEERDRLIITVYDKDDKEVASWADEDARQMFEDGFFKSRDLEQSVLEYLKDVKIIEGGY